MVQEYKFFNSAPGDSRKYQANDFADYFGSVLSTGLLHADGVPGIQARVQVGTLNTVVSEGMAIMKGHMYKNTTPFTLIHSIPEASMDRIDRIVLRLDLRNSERNILLHIKEGMPAAEPVVPELQRDNFIYEISLAQVRIRANTSTLDPTDLVDERLIDNLCGIVSSLISLPTTQFQEQWDHFFNNMNTDLKADQVAYRKEWQDWFNHIRDDGFANASDFNNHVRNDVQRIKVKQNVSILKTGWNLDSLSGMYKYTYNDADIFADSIVDVNVHLNDLTTAAVLFSATESFNGYVTLFARIPPAFDFLVDLKCIRQVF